MILAGFSKLYVIGGLGGFQGADGVYPIRLQIWLGEGDRQWLEPHYVDASIRPLGSVRTIIPDGPDAPIRLSMRVLRSSQSISTNVPRSLR